MSILTRDIINNPHKYIGKVVDAVGRVSGFPDDYVELEAGIDCALYHNDNLKMGQKVILRGTVQQGMFYKPLIKNCVVLKKYPVRF